MKKLFGIVAVAALVLMACVFTGCTHEYTGRYWITEYVKNISEEDVNNNYVNQSQQTKTAWRESWATTYSSSYVKKTSVTTPDLTAYMKSLMEIEDSEINSDLEEIGTIYSGMYYLISVSDKNTFNILYITEQE